MGETILDMDEEIELRYHKFNFLADKLGTSIDKFTDQMEKIHLTELFNKKDRVIKRQHKLLKSTNKLTFRITTIKIALSNIRKKDVRLGRDFEFLIKISK